LFFRAALLKIAGNIADGCVVLNLSLQLQTRRQLTLTTKRRIWYG